MKTYSGDIMGKLWEKLQWICGILEKFFCGQKGTGVILRLRLNIYDGV